MDNYLSSTELFSNVVYLGNIKFYEVTYILETNNKNEHKIAQWNLAFQPLFGTLIKTEPE